MSKDFPQNQILERSETYNWLAGQPIGIHRAASTSLDTNDTTATVLQDAIDASGSHIVILDKHQTILFVNRAWRQFAARTGSMTGQFGVGFKYPDIGMGTAATTSADSIVIADGIARVIAKKEIEFQMEYRCNAVTEPMWFRLHAAAFRSLDQDHDLLILVSHDDITSEKQANESLLRDRERLGRLWGTTNILPWEADADSWRFTHVGEQAEKMLGYPREMWFGPDFWTAHIHPDDREQVVAECTRLSQTEDQYQFEYRMTAKDGRNVWIRDVVNVSREQGVVTTISGFMIDITVQKQTEEALRLLSGRLITAREEERRRIARDLHDDLNQRMALVSIELEQIGQMLTSETDGIGERLRGVQRKALEISREIHQMSYALHPSKLDHLGLVPALKSFCSELSESRGIEIDFRDRGFPADLSTDITLCVFRIAQEGLQNAVKHSGAQQLSVLLKKTDHALELTITDTGCGFDTNSDKMTNGLGFIGMRERLRLVNGEITIRSKPSKGTQISIVVPIEKTVTLRPVLRAYN